MQEISPETLESRQQNGEKFQLIDVREAWEHKAFNIGGRLLPMSELMQRKDEIPRDVQVVLYCEKGIRSVIAIQRLESLGFGNLVNLSGGLKYWRQAAQ